MFRRPWAVAASSSVRSWSWSSSASATSDSRPIRAALVIPDGSGPAGGHRHVPGRGRRTVDIVAIDTTEAAARGPPAGEDAVDLIVIAPADGQATLERGPTGRPARRVRQHRSVCRAPGGDRRRPDRERRQSGAHPPRGERSAGGGRCRGTPLPPRYDAELVAAPTRAEVRDLAPTAPTITWFYGIAVLALIVQHVAVTLGALSIFRDGRRGLVELFRLSPIRSGELLIGKYLAIGLVSGVVSAALITLLVGAFRVPVLGDPAAVVLRHRAADAGRDRARAADRAGLGLGATGGPGDPARAPDLRVLRGAGRQPGCSSPGRSSGPPRCCRSRRRRASSTTCCCAASTATRSGTRCSGRSRIALFLASEIALRRKLAPIR